MPTRPLLPLTLIVALLTSMALAWPRGAQPPAYPPTKRDNHIDKVHGQDVADPFRWLERQQDAEVRKWVEAQNAFTRAYLDKLPGRQRIARRFAELTRIGQVTAPVVAKGRLFYLRRTGDQNQPVLYVREGLQGRDRAIINPNAADPTGLTAIDWFYPSPDGRYVAFGLSTAGTEQSTLHVADLVDWKLRPDKIDRTGFCSLAWMPDSSGFYYTRYPAPGSVPAGESAYHRHVYFHRLGADPEKDAKIFGDGRAKEDWFGVGLSPNGKWLIIPVAVGTSHVELFLKDTEAAEPPQSLGVKPGLIHDVLIDDDNLYIRTNDGAPRFKVMKASLARPRRADWHDLVPEHADCLEGFKRIGNRLILHYLRSVSSRLRIIDVGGREQPGVAAPPLGSVTSLEGDPNGVDLFFSYENFLEPTHVHHINLTTGQVDIWDKLTVPDFSAGDYVVAQVMAVSKDKTEVPLFIIHRRDLAKNGRNATLLYGYGGFGISLTPHFSPAIIQFIEKGGCYAVANLRGGNEFGETWHEAGKFGKKQNVFDDFIAAAEHLGKEKYTEPRRLAIQGASNGGLLVAAVVTQRPDLCRAAVCQVPLTDMVRFNRFGLANLWASEYGNPDKAEEFAWLLKYSPYHNIKDQTPYPAMLITAAEGDARVDPLHACKLTATLQAASASERPVLLRLEAKAGHGAGKSRRQMIEEQTDVWSFLYHELGLSP
jgi:prolyl oligopeptidase